MSKSVLLSIRPKWCELIACGKKTLEVRKTRPKIETPFKCYIYCTKDSYKEKFLHTSNKHGELLFWGNPDDAMITVQPEDYKYRAYTCRGKVIGEFVCDKIDKYTAEFVDDDCYEDIRYHYTDCEMDEHELIVTSNRQYDPSNCVLCKKACLSFYEIKQYVGINFHDKPFYGWHISNLVIYDQPKELGEFKGLCKERQECSRCPYYDWYSTKAPCEYRRLKYPPQSWCYVC